MMGQYLNPASIVQAIGRELTARSYSDLQAQLRPGESLVGFGDKLIFNIAIVIPDEREHQFVSNAHSSGELVSLKFYAVPYGEIKNHDGSQ